MSNCTKRREQDEYVCHECGKRWGTDEPEPACPQDQGGDDD